MRRCNRPKWPCYVLILLGCFISIILLSSIKLIFIGLSIILIVIGLIMLCS